MSSVSSIQALEYTTMTATVRNIKRPNVFLQSFLWSNHRSNSTEAIEIGHKTKGRTMAPLVRSGAEGVIVGGMAPGFRYIKPPNIRIKHEFNPQKLFFERTPGHRLFVDGGGGDQISSAEEYVADELQQMDWMIVNTIEWMCGQLLQGGIEYSVNDREYYSITLPRSSSHNIVPTTFWDDNDPTLPEPLLDIDQVKELLSESEGLNVTDAICGTEAATALMRLVNGGHLKMLGQAGLQVTAGKMSFVEQYNEEGVVYLGELGGVDFWKYVRTAAWEGGDGTAISMIRPKYVEFVSRSPQSDRVMEFGAIPEVINDQLTLVVGERFAKSWSQNDPPSVTGLVTSRPIPWARKPDATISFKAVSG